jgi:hypothetical protein
MRGVLILGLVVVAACSRGYDPDRMDDPDDVGAKDWSADLAARAGSGIEGSANVQSVYGENIAGNTAASVTIGGANAGAEHPWHLHVGTCATGGGIVGAANAYPALRPGANGNATATASLAVGLDPNAAYHVNVHRSPSDLGTVVACGDLQD